MALLSSCYLADNMSLAIDKIQATPNPMTDGHFFWLRENAVGQLIEVANSRDGFTARTKVINGSDRCFGQRQASYSQAFMWTFILSDPDLA